MGKPIDDVAFREQLLDKRAVLFFPEPHALATVKISRDMRGLVSREHGFTGGGADDGERGPG